MQWMVPHPWDVTLSSRPCAHAHSHARTHACYHSLLLQGPKFYKNKKRACVCVCTLYRVVVVATIYPKMRRNQRRMGPSCRFVGAALVGALV
jgi:hypothetical protein